MRESKHTAGPWHRFNDEINNRDGLTVARVVQFVAEHRSESNANMRLIAAAPDLLEALRGMVRWNVKRGGDNDKPLPIEQQDPEVALAMVAIAKTEGRS